MLVASALAVLLLALASGADREPTSAPSRPATYPAPINPEEVPLATSADIWVGITTIPEGSSPDMGKDAKPTPPQASGIFAYVVNKSDHPIRLYMPGLVGPNFGAQKGVNVEALDQPTYRGARFRSGDFVILLPGEMYARRARELRPNERDLQVFAYYLIFPPDKMGHWSEPAEIVYPGGNVVKVKR